MLCVRYMSFCEFAALTVGGEVNAQTAPYAAISADDDLSDTTPAPPVGALLLWPAEAEAPCAWQFGPFAVRFAVPDEQIIWRGTGHYDVADAWKLDDIDRSYSVDVPEVGVWHLCRAWIDAVVSAPTYRDEEHALEDCPACADQFLWTGAAWFRHETEPAAHPWRLELAAGVAA